MIIASHPWRRLGALVCGFALAGVVVAWAQPSSPLGQAGAQQALPLHAASGPWRPFLDPIIIHDSWYFLIIPIAFLMSMAYKAVRCHDMRRYWRAVIAMTLQVVLGMIALGAGFWIMIEFVLPRIAP